ncbi:MAG TPA: beta-ketoacyl-[acyl-carrier-protein] synthase family protein [Bacteroidales bacterium]|nr:beta-ketoacyl-[acyl-carrier-protein] synthase family protein [Bacteroidales bacterium]
MTRNVLVTGLGIVSGIGISVQETLASLLAGQSGIGAIKYLQTNHKDYPCSEVPLSDEQMCSMLSIPRNIPFTRTSLMGILAAKNSLSHAGLTPHKSLRIGFISGTTVGGMEKSEQYYKDFLENNTRNDYIKIHDCGASTEVIADYFGGFSYVSTISTACSSSANAIVLGANLIRLGLLDCVVAGGTECLTKFHLNGFKTLMILDKVNCRPFDAERAGLNLGEGAAYIVMESAESARNRKADVLCKVSGYGNACDAFHQTASSPDGKGATLAMQSALEMSGLKPSDIDYINAHGTGTTNNDESEGTAIMNVFGNSVPPVSSTKAFTGHTTSASGSVEAVISILAMNNGFLPPNLNFKTRIEKLSFSPVSKLVSGVKINHVLSNSFGFGGNNTSMVFSKMR